MDKDRQDEQQDRSVAYPVSGEGLARPVPATVKGDVAIELYGNVNNTRRMLKDVGALAKALRSVASIEARGSMDGEVAANITIAYRHIEDASMRLGKALQALDGGVSVYDRATTVDV